MNKEMKYSDEFIKKAIQSGARPAPRDPWFTAKAMNRLPPRQPSRSVAWPSLLCYALAALLLATTAWWVVAHATFGTVLLLGVTLPLVAALCIGLIAAPALRKALY